MPASEKIFENGEADRNDTIVILEDGETFSGAHGCTIRRDGREFDILKLLDFWENNSGNVGDYTLAPQDRVEIK